MRPLLILKLPLEEYSVSVSRFLFFDLTCFNDEYVVSHMYVLANIERSFRAQFRNNGWQKIPEVNCIGLGYVDGRLTLQFTELHMSWLWFDITRHGIIKRSNVRLKAFKILKSVVELRTQLISVLYKGNVFFLSKFLQVGKCRRSFLSNADLNICSYFYENSIEPTIWQVVCFLPCNWKFRTFRCWVISVRKTKFLRKSTFWSLFCSLIEFGTWPLKCRVFHYEVHKI
jgi:hypothetical protein